MSAKEAQELRQEIKEKQESARKMLQQREEALKRTHELQMLHSQSVFKIDEACQMVNNRLRELTAVAPDASCLPHLDYNVSQRADVGVLERLLEQNRRIKVRNVHTGINPSKLVKLIFLACLAFILFHFWLKMTPGLHIILSLPLYRTVSCYWPRNLTTFIVQLNATLLSCRQQYRQ